MLSRKPRKRKCAWCSERFQPRQMGQKVCSPSCALAYTRAERARKAHSKPRGKVSPKVRTLAQECALAQRYVNEYIRLRDAGKGCISCDSPKVEHAGHFIHAGSKYRTSRIRFDERVISGQCLRCNVFAGGGNQEGYRQGIIKRYGQQRLDEIEELQRKADSGELEPLTKDEVRQIAAEFRERVKRMKGANNA